MISITKKKSTLTPKSDPPTRPLNSYADAAKASGLLPKPMPRPERSPEEQQAIDEKRRKKILARAAGTSGASSLFEPPADGVGNDPMTSLTIQIITPGRRCPPGTKPNWDTILARNIKLIQQEMGFTNAGIPISHARPVGKSLTQIILPSSHLTSAKQILDKLGFRHWTSPPPTPEFARASQEKRDQAESQSLSRILRNPLVSKNIRDAYYQAVSSDHIRTTLDALLVSTGNP